MFETMWYITRCSERHSRESVHGTVLCRTYGQGIVNGKYGKHGKGVWRGSDIEGVEMV